MAGTKGRAIQSSQVGRRSRWRLWRSIGRVVMAVLVLAMILSLVFFYVQAPNISR